VPKLLSPGNQGPVATNLVMLDGLGAGNDRVFAENIEQAARNYEKSFEAVSNIIAQQSQARQ
jgi:hypothetical protein